MPKRPDQDDPEVPIEGHDSEVEEAGDTTRRATLRKLAAGLGLVAGGTLLPERWTKPVVESIISPVHAQGESPPNGDDDDDDDDDDIN